MEKPISKVTPDSPWPHGRWAGLHAKLMQFPLGAKTFVIIAFTTLVLMAIVYYASQLTFYRNYKTLETRESTQDVNRAASALSDAVSDLDTSNHDWAVWDDCYRFANDGNEYFIAGNFNDTTFINVKLNALIIVNASGQVVHGKAFDLETERAVPVPGSLMDEITPNSLLEPRDPDSGLSGIIMLPEGALMVSARSILTSAGNGPAAGTIIMGRFIDADVITGLSATMHLPLQMQSYGDQNGLSPDFQTASANLSTAAPVFIQPLSRETIAGYGLVTDIWGVPAFILKVEVPRDIYAQAQTTMRIFLLALLAVGLGLGLFMFFLIRWWVILRLTSLSRRVKEIGASGNLTARLPEAGADEVSELTRDINIMLQALAHSQETILAGEKKFRDLIQQASDGIAIIREDAIIYANPRFYEMTGYSADELDAASLQNMAPSDAIPGLAKWWRAADNRVSFEMTLIRKTGTAIPVEMNSSTIEYEDAPCHLLMVRDIAERRKAEEVLRDSEMKFRSLAESASDAIITTDNNMSIRYYNQAAEDIFGYEKDELIGKPLSILIGQEYRQFFKQRMEKSPAEPPSLSAPSSSRTHPFGKAVELKGTKKDRTELFIELSVSRWRVGGEVFFTGMFRDISERKAAEASLRSQKELIDRILAATPNATLVVNRERRVLLGNESFCRLCGDDGSKVVGKRIDGVDCLTNLIPAILGTLYGQGIQETEFKYTFQGNPRDFNATIIPMQGEEVLVILVDVTGQREKQEKLYMTHKLASIGIMTAGIAHELNNPLTSVIGLSQLLAQKDLPKETKEDLDTIHTQARRAATIVKNLLTFSRKHAAIKQAAPLNSILDDVLNLRAYEHKLSNITVVRQFDNTLPELTLDSFQMQQTFLNIILNAEDALNATRRGGTLTVSTQKLHDKVRISFTDDGMGISPENLPRLFTPFFTTKEVGRGTGLGLSIVYGIVTDHGGRVWAESEPGKGANFIIELPLNIPSDVTAIQDNQP
jgi:PAS domain S-box-containing protein